MTNPCRTDRRFKPFKKPVPLQDRYESVWQEDVALREHLRNSENGLLLALRDAHPELECRAFQTQGPF